MTARHCTDPSGSKLVGGIIQFRDPANEPWLMRPVTTTVRQAELERSDMLCEIECLRAEADYLKNELERVTQERDILRNANRIISITISAHQRDRGTPEKSRPSGARNAGKRARPR